MFDLTPFLCLVISRCINLLACLTKKCLTRTVLLEINVWLIWSSQISIMANLTNYDVSVPICLCLLFYVYMSMSIQGEADEVEMLDTTRADTETSCGGVVDDLCHCAPLVISKFFTSLLGQYKRHSPRCPPPCGSYLLVYTILNHQPPLGWT